MAANDQKERAATIAAYNRGAKHFSEKFRKIGPRTDDIERAFALIRKPNPHVVELGCGDGRDAVEILQHTDTYIGIDASEGMIAIAQQKLPNATLIVADMVSAEIPTDTDIVLAFASMLHLSKEENRGLISRLHQCMTAQGIMHISVKEAPYRQEFIDGPWGPRVFYFYEESDVVEMTAGLFAPVTIYRKDIAGVHWLDVILRKIIA